MIKNIAYIPGDGVGPEIMAEAAKVLIAIGEKSGIEFKFRELLAGGIAIDKFGVPMPEETLEGCRESDAILFGSVGGPKWDNEPWENVHTAITPSRGIQLLRQTFELYGNIRPAKPYPCLYNKSPLKPEILKDADVIVVREQCGGLYFGEPRGIFNEKGIRRGVNTLSYREDEVERIARLAFNLAKGRSKKITSVDKHNVMESSILWRQVVEKVALDYPEIEVEHMYADNAALQLVLDPKRFDVIVTGNIFGDILSDLTACYHASLGLMPSASIGDSKFGLYEPIHGTAPDIAGKNIANPLSAILSAKMMLEYSFDLEEEALRIDKAVEKVLNNGYRTADIYSEGDIKVSTSEMGDLIVRALQE
ncbi:MAG: 3-isopropylmalate dehydrogenase [Peptococcaceae bacterium BICA1-8]|nr:MAG: 3-isopropylmalate dehydrogenase [Peptococcaceae bacterium BICA1-8]